MTEVQSITSAPSRKPRKPKKPAKPYAEFPLTAHPTGRWCKKVNGKLYYFGPWEDWQGALKCWEEDRDGIYAGRGQKSKRVASGEPTLVLLVNTFLTTKQRLVEAGELSPYTWNSYNEICGHLIEAFGRERLLSDLLPADFEQLRAKWASKWGVVRLAAEVNRARVVFNYAWNNAMLAAPIRFGEGFKRPSKKALLLNKHEQDAKMFEAEELRRMLKSATQPMRAMLLLGVNAGLGNTDVAKLRMKNLDLDRGWINYPRPKTGVARRCPLWPETIKAVREWLKVRPAPASDDVGELVFLTFRGKSWTPNLKSRPLTNEMRKLLIKLGITGHRGYFCLCHTFATIRGDSLDQVAVDSIMGHDDGSMSANHRERIADDRLIKVTQHVHQWLFAKVSKKR